MVYLSVYFTSSTGISYYFSVFYASANLPILFLIDCLFSNFFGLITTASGNIIEFTVLLNANSANLLSNS
jgi:hypothetical protein